MSFWKKILENEIIDINPEKNIEIVKNKIYFTPLLVKILKIYPQNFAIKRVMHIGHICANNTTFSFSHKNNNICFLGLEYHRSEGNRFKCYVYHNLTFTIDGYKVRDIIKQKI